MKLNLRPGMRVHHLILNRDGFIEGAGQNGRWSVIIGNLKVQSQSHELEPLTTQKPKHAVKLKRKGEAVARPMNGPSRGYVTLDLHGLRVAEALEKIEALVSSAIVERRRGLEIIHGLGTGRLQEALHTYLQNCDVVARFHLAPQNPGITWIHFY
jgi:DNA mismatch repair protein MutS2